MFSGKRLVLLMAASLIFNTFAMLLTVHYLSSGAVVEANPVTRSSLSRLGDLTLISNAALVLLVYAGIFRVGRRLQKYASNSLNGLANLALDFSALLLPVVSLLDAANDVAVAFFSLNLMALGQLLTISPIAAFDLVLLSRASRSLRSRQGLLAV